MGDTGLTGRKIIVDTYGGAARTAAARSPGKDPTKVDRSAAYAARYVAKNVVAAGLADRCQIQVAYAIGVAHPFSVLVETLRHRARSRSSGSRSSSREHFDLRPAAILRDLDLRRPIYAKTAAYGHFGRDDHDFTWERTDKADALREAAGLEALANALADVRALARATRAGRRGRRRPSRRSPSRRRSGGRGTGLRPARLRELDRRAGHEALVVEPVQEVAVVLGEPDDRRLGARLERRERRELEVLAPARATVSTGQPCGQRSGWPSFSSIRSTMSSVNVSPSSSACTCASAAV